MITIYSDGGCAPNPGLGAWAFVAIQNGQETLMSGYIGQSTNSICELTAAIEALRYVRLADQEEVNFYLDSDYVRKGITEWIPNWINPTKKNRKPWHTANGDPVKNQELWKQLYHYNFDLEVHWHWVKGHSGNHYNEMVDKEVARIRLLHK